MIPQSTPERSSLCVPSYAPGGPVLCSPGGCHWHTVVQSRGCSNLFRGRSLLACSREKRRKTGFTERKVFITLGNRMTEKEGSFCMKRFLSLESRIPDPSVTARPAIGANSRPLRFLIVGLVVIVWWTLGFLLHLTTPAFLLLGVPLLVVFQVG